jgi:hypothetical protein
MPFRLTNTLRTFQQYVDKALHPYLNLFWATYLDNVLIYSKTLENHIQHVCQVLSLLQQASQQVKPQKCEFRTTTTEYLKILVTFEGLKMDPDKVSAVEQWPIPQ